MNSPIDLRMHRRPGVKARGRFYVVIGMILLIGAACLLCAAKSITQTPAAGILILVDSTGDGVNMGSGNVCDDGTGHCTLRAAIQLVNGRNNGSDHIAIGVTGTIALSNALPNLNVPVSISGPGADNLTVQNANPGNNNAFRIFNVTTSGTVSFSGITIAHGDVFSPTDYLGAGIQNYNAGIVNVTNCTLTANDAHQWFDQNGNVGPASPGGGIANRGGGTINITSSTFTENNADVGGGIYNSSTGIINVTNSTLSQNSSGSGGGIYNLGTITITNSTLDHNDCVGGTSGRNGGGIYNFAGTVNLIRSTLGPGNFANFSNGGGIFNDDSGTVNVINSTIFFNTTEGNGFPGTGNGGGIYNKATLNVSNSTIALNVIDGGTSSAPIFGCGIYNDSAGVATIKSSIIANNEFVTGADFGGGFDVYGSFNSQGYNLIRIRDDSTGFTAATDQTGTCAGPNPGCNAPLDPQFEYDNNGPILKNNGGPTQTLALLPNSPAIDKGTSNGLTGVLATDQRGTPYPRTFDIASVANATGGDGADVGAFEFLAIRITSISRLTNRHIMLQALGIPNGVHHVQASPDLNPSNFANIGTATADSTGALQFDDAGAVSLTKRFYRVTFP
jgi:hypothetical protein